MADQRQAALSQPLDCALKLDDVLVADPFPDLRPLGAALPTKRERLRAALDTQREREAADRVRLRELRKQLCGAKTRAGHPCRAKGLGRGGRCRMHGGAPLSAAGRQRIVDANRRRWAAWRAAKRRE
jgi:hypothetical protein